MNSLGAIWFHDWVSRLRWELEQQEWAHWVLASCAIMIFFEVPRYYLSSLGAAIAHFLRYPRWDRDKVEALWKRAPLVSIVVAGRNEGKSIGPCIESLLEQNYTNYEIIVVDDSSDDETTSICRKYAREGKIRLLRNSGLCGRGGRPAATNLGLSRARGEFLISVDADCLFDRNLILHALAPFSDPKVGVVAGNVHIRNPHRTLISKLQALEYTIGIDLRKRWTTLCKCTLQASGALGAFRRAALDAIGGWDPELAEDTDVSLRMRKAGFDVAFAPGAVVFTEGPSTWKSLVAQRTRWDRGGLRNYFVKHGRLLNPRHAGWSFSLEMWCEFLVTTVATAAYPIYFVWMAIVAPHVLALVLVLTTLLGSWLSLLTLFVASRVAIRLEQPSRMIGAALAMPFYKSMLRWFRFRSLLLEIFRVDYEDPFLPRTVWHEVPRSWAR